MSDIDTRHDTDIVFVRYNFPLPGEPGPNRHLDIVKALARDGYDVTVLTGTTSFMSEDDRSNHDFVNVIEKNWGTLVQLRTLSDYKVNIIRRLASYGLFAIETILQLVRFDDPDIIMMPAMPLAIPPLVVVPAKATGASFILEVNDLPETAVALGYLKSPVSIKLLDWVFSQVYRLADKIITVTPGAEDYIVKAGVKDVKVTTIRNWADPSLSYEQVVRCRSVVRSEIGWHDQYVVLYAGSFGKAYDLETFVKAAALLSDESRIRFVLMGAGPDRDRLKELKVKLEADNCSFIAPKPRRELYRYLVAADLTTNLFYSGAFWEMVIGHKIIDYMICSRPILFAGSGDTAELIREAGAGKSVRPERPRRYAQAVSWFCDNSEDGKRMGWRGRRFVEEELSQSQSLRGYCNIVGEQAK